MLEQDYQLAGYKELNAAGGLATPAAITATTDCQTTASDLSQALTALVLTSVTYPDTVTSSVARITEEAKSLSDWSGVAASI